MADIDREGLPVLGLDYDLVRWTDNSRDAEGNLIWHENYPSNRDWDRIRMVTVDLDPAGEGKFRNIPISADRPLDPYGSWSPSYRGPHKGGREGEEYYFDLDDAAYRVIQGYGTP